MTNPQNYLLKWAQLDFLTQDRIKILRSFFGNLETAWNQGTEANFIEAGIPTRSVKSFFDKKQNLNLEKDYEKFIKTGAKLVFIEDKNYPQKLKEISAPPIFLFMLGEILPEDDLAFAIVGSRNLTANGKQSVSNLTPQLVNSGLTIVSGLARGVDSFAHKECLNNKGRTIGVLGSGIDNIYPYENKILAQKIANGNGAVISEFPIGTTPQNFNFPRRNRIISGLSLGVLIIEGKEKSGSLITAKIALEQNREVFAIPGSPFLPLAKGPNKLIQNGEAKLVQNADDILVELSINQKKSESTIQRALPKNDNELKILDILSNEPKMFDEIVNKSELLAATASSVLTILEMKGYVHNTGMGQWSLNN